MSVYLTSSLQLPSAAYVRARLVRISVFYAGGEKLHCVSFLAYANVTGESGSWGGSVFQLLRLREAKGSFRGASDGSQF